MPDADTHASATDDTQHVGTRIAAQELGRSQRVVNRWINDGVLRAERAFEGGPWVIELREVRRLRDASVQHPRRSMRSDTPAG